MTVLTRARRATGLTQRLGQRTNPAGGPRQFKTGTIGALLIAIVLSLGFAAPANAASPRIGFHCYSSPGNQYWCNPYETAGGTVLASAGLYNGNGHDYTVFIDIHSQADIKVRVVADNGHVI